MVLPSTFDRMQWLSIYFYLFMITLYCCVRNIHHCLKVIFQRPLLVATDPKNGSKLIAQFVPVYWSTWGSMLGIFSQFALKHGTKYHLLFCAVIYTFDIADGALIHNTRSVKRSSATVVSLKFQVISIHSVHRKVANETHPWFGKRWQFRHSNPVPAPR